MLWVREIESNLIFALRTILVQIKSGVSLFDSLYSISSGKRYGELGAELKEAVDNISTGVSEEVALQELAVKNPNPYLRKVLWQIVNGMKAGIKYLPLLLVISIVLFFVTRVLTKTFLGGMVL